MFFVSIRFKILRIRDMKFRLNSILTIETTLIHIWKSMFKTILSLERLILKSKMLLE
jgi:hypothetical protein